jgi:glycosyltransferase involved in cell wall biosynthesis
MVTANRRRLAARSILCFQRQTYPDRELVIVDDGQEDLTPILEELPPEMVRYVRLEKNEANVLGRLRNLSLETATGDIMAQWDDDDWYHPERLERQFAAIARSGADACCLSGALMHLDTPEFFDHPYVGYLTDGVPGSIMHRRDADIRYPETRRAEDTEYLHQWLQRPYVQLPKSESHLFIRCFHGANTWEQKHFLTRMRNTPRDAAAYVWYRSVRRNLFLHPRFRLTPVAREAFEAYLSDSSDLGLFQTVPPTSA